MPSGRWSPVTHTATAGLYFESYFYHCDPLLYSGAGTGIGRSLAETLALQGLNVVLVSLPDKHLEETTHTLKKHFPNQQFISVPASFDHKTDYMPAIIEVLFFIYFDKFQNKS